MRFSFAFFGVNERYGDFSSTTWRQDNADIESVDKNWGWAKVVFHSTDAMEVTDTAADGKHDLASLTGHYESKSPPFFLSNIAQLR
jgi:hypothetical protein